MKKKIWNRGYKNYFLFIAIIFLSTISAKNTVAAKGGGRVFGTDIACNERGIVNNTEY